MTNKSNYEFLLSDLTKLKGVGDKTTSLLKKRKLIIFLIYYGNYPNHI
jgi:ATP-dependent DNA helicase RecG